VSCAHFGCAHIDKTRKKYMKNIRIREIAKEIIKEKIKEAESFLGYHDSASFIYKFFVS